jgi:plasmid replication initiation protein
MVGEMSNDDAEFGTGDAERSLIPLDRSPLLPDRHPIDDLFVCDFLDAVPKGDMASMEHPFFTLSTKPDRRPRRYENGEHFLEVKPSSDGLATVYDRDVLIYCISQIMAARNAGQLDRDYRRLKINPYDLLTKTNRMTNGQGYDGLITALDRLAGTRIVTNIKIGGKITREGFGLIDKYKIVRDEKTERMQELFINVSDWMLDAINASEVLTLHRDYFRLRKPLERRMYELARKHCGRQAEWKISLAKLHEKTGSASTKKEFKRLVGTIVTQDQEHGHFPDYALSMEGDAVMFTNRRNAPAKQIALNLHDHSRIRLNPDTYAIARKVAPGYDIHNLEAEWRDWLASKDKPLPENPDAAFVGFCKNRHKRKPLN